MFFAGFISLYNIHRIQASTFITTITQKCMQGFSSEDVILVSDVRKEGGKEGRKERRKEGRKKEKERRKEGGKKGRIKGKKE